MQTREHQTEPAGRRATRRWLSAVPASAQAMSIGEWQARLKAGKEAKKRAGGYVGGRPTIGFRAQSGQLIADAREQAIISRCLELREAGYTYRQIAEVLEGEGRRNRSGTTSWHPETISRICRQPD